MYVNFFYRVEKIFCLENFYALLNNIIEKECISKEDFFTKIVEVLLFIITNGKGEIGVV